LPGYIERESLARCPECDGPDVGSAGFYLHYPTCSTQPDHEEAQRREADYKAARRREIDELVASPEAKRLRALRTARRD
jgi:hypothetical protein